ncbi:MAG: YHS domain-containing (seleno)protein [Limnobacter sp.]|uniref:YHS domain-containing (seleno)protein n=1 Tax=Limnobacter sp. TaxID=2003368 RepID=UPI0022C7D706|nr:YHS domain-containing (seleno)protein [Limnobacter sp.]MCZ8014841.1 YHS domain-containing (seleno)protein [Limnobacter sp.]
MTRTHKLLFAASLILSLGACSSMSAQNPANELSPVNAAQAEGADRVMLFGADVVAYFTTNAYVQGSAKFSSTYKDVDFHFSSAENKALFDQSPEQYLPQYGGYCANGIMFGIPWGGNATDFKMVNGKLYIFGGQVSQAAFELELDKNIALADQYWEQEIKGNNSFIQRTKRLVLRVPHYKTGEEQAAQVKAAQKPGV